MNKIRKVLIENTMYEDGAFAIEQITKQILDIIDRLVPKKYNKETLPEKYKDCEGKRISAEYRWWNDCVEEMEDNIAKLKEGA